jgi:hypothetical protein
MFLIRRSTDYNKKVADMTNKFAIDASKARAAANEPEVVRRFKHESTMDATLRGSPEEQARARELLVASIGDLGIYNLAGTGATGYSG